jgi:hypothetical protein
MAHDIDIDPGKFRDGCLAMQSPTIPWSNVI